MALGINHQSQTTLAVIINEIWQGKKVNEFFRAKLSAANFFLDMSEEIRTEGDILHIGNTTEPTTSTKANGSPIDYQSPTETETQLTVTTWKYAAKLIEKRETNLVLNSFNLQERNVKGLAYACAKDYDSAILGLYSGLSQNVNDFTSDLTDAAILQSIATLDAEDVPAEDRMFFFRPEVFWQDLQAIAKYYDSSQFGGETSTKTGRMPRLYDIPATVTTQVPVTNSTEAHNLLAHKDAFVHAVKGSGVDMQSDWIPDYLATQIAADVVYGVAENRDVCAVELRSQLA